jgi:prepilin-type N-terminal cleavage/methylation domain-containing protein
MPAQAGVTLIELLIAISLLAMLSAGLLMSLRSGFFTLNRTGERLRSNRRQLTIERILNSEVSNVMPVIGTCGPVFRGNPATLRFVSSYSIAEGSRGLPRVVEMQVAPGNGGLSVIVNEAVYSGPLSTAPLCSGAPAIVTPNTFVAADGLSDARFLYLESVTDSVKPGNWVTVWDRPNLPAAVRLEMVPIRTSPGLLPVLPVTAKIHITREVQAPYADSQ